VSLWPSLIFSFSNSLFPSLGGDFLGYPFCFLYLISFFFLFVGHSLVVLFTFFFGVDGEQGQTTCYELFH
jgi:hypothetical protein